MTDKNYLETVLRHFPELDKTTANLMKEEIKKTDFTKLSHSDIENLIAQLDDNKKQMLIDILKTVK